MSQPSRVKFHFALSTKEGALKYNTPNFLSNQTWRCLEVAC